jgi:hypothetical protein
MNDSQLQEIRDEWCREMARQAMRDAKEIDARITAARAKRLARQSSPEVTHALDREIAMLQRIREELESDVEDWVKRRNPHGSLGKVAPPWSKRRLWINV